MTSTLSMPQAVWNHLAAWIRDEGMAQDQRLIALQDLHASLAQRDSAIVDSMLAKVQEQDKTSRSRETKRKAIFEALGKHWGVNASVLTLGSIAERLGDGGAELMELRAELVGKLKLVSTAARQVSATAHMHRSVICDVLNVLFDGNDGDPLEEQGRLLDAEA